MGFTVAREGFVLDILASPDQPRQNARSPLVDKVDAFACFGVDSNSFLQDDAICVTIAPTKISSRFYSVTRICYCFYFFSRPSLPLPVNSFNIVS